MNCLRLIPTALAFLFAVITPTAQDVIVLKDGSTVLSKVTEITKDQVRFKKNTRKGYLRRRLPSRHPIKNHAIAHVRPNRIS